MYDLALSQWPQQADVKPWNRAQKRAEQLQAEGAERVIYIVEAAVSVNEEGSLLAFGKGIQVAASKDKAKSET